MYEAVSTVDSSYQAKAIEEYQNLFKYSDSAKGTDGKILPAIEVHLWEEDLRYAVLIYRQDPVKNLNEAQAHIKAAIDRVATNPQLNELGLPIYIKNRASGLEGARGMNKLILLAKIYPPFRDFAQKYGVTIPASKQ
jgi:hypothetical protein